MWWKLLGLTLVTMGAIADERAIEKNRPIQEKLPAYGSVYGDIIPDKVEVVSSALRILPRRVNPEKAKSMAVNVAHGPSQSRQRRATSVEGSSWRKPREYEFVTRREWNNAPDGRWVNGAEGRAARLLDEPESSASRYYADERLPYDGYFSRRSGPAPPQKQRIIYYATLPEIVRRPGEWTPPRRIFGGYPGNHPRDNEVVPGPPRPSPIDDNYYSNDGGTRVSSSIIGFSDKHDIKPYPSSSIDDLSSPKFTIIDAEPPYNYRGPPRPDRYDLRYDNRYDQDKYDYDRYDQRFNAYRNHGIPYGGDDRPFFGSVGGGGDRRAGPPRQPEVPLPPLPLTIVRNPIDVRPLDVRPLDPSDTTSRFTTQGPPISSPTSTASPTSTTSTTTGTILASFERSYNSKF